MAQTPMAHPIAALRLSKRVKNVIVFAKSVATAMTDNAYLPSPNPPLATFNADIAGLDTSETAVLARTKGAAEARNVKLATVHADLQSERAYVQQIANANPGNAEAIIQSAGMFVRTVTLHPKSELSAQQGSVSGTVHLIAKAAAHRASYEWQYSTDQKTWTVLPVTLQAKTDVGGLTVGTTYYFRVRPVTLTGEGNWTQVVSLNVS